MTTDLCGISRASFDLIVAEEITGQAYYEKRYRRSLEHPSDNSGPTGGIGYDCGTQSRAQILADWTGRVDAGTLKILAGAAGLRSEKAAAYCRKTRGLIDIPFDVAMDVFANRNVPQYYAIMCRYLPGVEQLAPDCQGALLSITFNRDAGGFVKPGARYVEMRGIRDAVRSGAIERIPALIRSMKRLWPATSGLVPRREREAVLFEKGLADHHPDAHAALPAVAELPDPEVVARVQQSLRNLGYFQVGAVDGQATPGGKLEDAILSFRNKNGLPLSTAIDDEFLNALAKARPPEIAEERAQASTADLRSQGSETISFTDKVKAWAGRIFGGGAGLGGAGSIALITEKATEAKGARDALGALGLSTDAWLLIIAGIVGLLVLAGCGVALWYVANRIEQKRLADYRIGKNP